MWIYYTVVYFGLYIGIKSCQKQILHVTYGIYTCNMRVGGILSIQGKRVTSENKKEEGHERLMGWECGQNAWNTWMKISSLKSFVCHD